MPVRHDGYKIDNENKKLIIDLHSPAGNIFAVLALAEGIINDPNYAKDRLNKAEVFKMSYEDFLEVIKEDLKKVGYEVEYIERGPNDQ